MIVVNSIRESHHQTVYQHIPSSNTQRLRTAYEWESHRVR